MNPQDYDHPDLTAYALGELDPAEAERVRNWLTQSPEAKAEFERVQHVLGFLQDAPTLPKRSLNSRQRETVLTMGQIPAQVSRPKNVVPFLGFRRPAGSGTRPSALWQGVKYAAAACLVAGAFMMGQRTSNRITPLVTTKDVPTAETPQVDLKTPQPKVAPAPETPQIAVTPAPAPKPAEVTPPKSEAPARAVATAPSVPPAAAGPKASPAPNTAPQPTAPASAPVVAAKPAPSAEGFYLPAKSPEAILQLEPKAIRPLPVPHEFAGVVLASPMAPDVKPESKPEKPEAQPALNLSWKAEIATCPWDAGRRLMRVVAQIPVDQPGIENFDTSYPLVVKFDPFQVQGYRLVTEKYLRASAGNTQATRFAWYEIIPARNFNASAEKPVTIGTITIEQPRGTNSDVPPLKLSDRGLTWSDWGEAFGFETAMIGWNMLLKGTENIGGLNSKIVLDLAEKTRGDDSKGERVKFINAVKQAQRAVGM
jgi:anti-sigma factor RsiW